MFEKDAIITLLGSSGGVAKAVLSIFNKAAKDPKDPIHQIMKNARFHLIDLKQRELTYFERIIPNLIENVTFHEMNVNNIDLMKKHLIESNTVIVVDVSRADSVEMLRCCNEFGVKYVNTALESEIVDDDESISSGFPLKERLRIFEENKRKFKNTTAIIGSGMNPGIVQWMAIDLMNQFPSEKPLACYIVEHDNSFYENPSIAQKETIYTTWSPDCFLEEAVTSFPMFVKQNIPIFLYDDVYSVEFKVTLGEKVFYGCLMPHEEVFIIGKLFNLESGFVYRVNEHTTNLIKNNLKNTDEILGFDKKLLDPSTAPLVGEDVVGVLLVYEDKERYIYNVMNNKDSFANYGTNATYLQVACGVYAGVASLLLDTVVKGAYFVDELVLNTNSKYGEYLKYHMTQFVYGENEKSDGLLLQRMKSFDN
ncbi:S-adenosylmethionine decarboxylase related protein [Gottfriedia acidiceleris]|uniref:S-adenosylmethionine decarboxylase related protein n=1 Tax=Bacillaceae TaxID=186817 RepID=UPI000BEDE706|nr:MULTISPECIES: S-adenosylmethionine decarboxylase related protein [unclassified Bacillus (in: firmicutes)]PEC48283.1 S-adenosylmethionine decarboxylase related protein [Bacillus sp. AFS096315]PFM75050.1 S-adenosylmethionine decarboxylase related protein [Bacillus sp. AFS077874]